MTEFETNSKLCKFLTKNVFMIPKLLTCEAYYKKCIAYNALKASMQSVFRVFLTTGLKKIATGQQQNLTLPIDGFNKLNDVMQVWDGDLFDLMDDIEFLHDTEKKKDILTDFQAMISSANQNEETMNADHEEQHTF